MVYVSLDVVQELVLKTAVIVLEVYRRALADLGVFFDVLIGCVRVLEANKLHSEV